MIDFAAHRKMFEEARAAAVWRAAMRNKWHCAIGRIVSNDQLRADGPDAWNGRDGFRGGPWFESYEVAHG